MYQLMDLLEHRIIASDTCVAEKNLLAEVDVRCI